MKTLDWIAGVLAVIGALNWGLIGFFDFNLVTAIFSGMHGVVDVVYCIVGIAGIWMIFAGMRCCRK